MRSGPGCHHAAECKKGPGTSRRRHAIADLLAFFQVACSFSVSIPIKWPSVFVSLSLSIGNIVDLGFLGSYDSLDCQMRGNFCTDSLPLLLCPLLFFVGFWAAALFAGTRHPRGESVRKEMVDKLIHFTVMIALLAHPVLSVRLLKSYDTEDLSRKS